MDDKDFDDIFKLINERETDDVKFERLKDTFTLECNRCEEKTAKHAVVFGWVCWKCDPHLIQKRDI